MPNPDIIYQNLSVVSDILQAVSVMLGVALFVSGMFRLKRYGEMRTFMSHQMTLATPIFMMIAGIILLTLPTFIGTVMLSFYGSTSVMAYEGADNGLDQFIPVVILFVRIIGVGAFMRGVVLLSRAGGQQSQPGTFSKAFLHIFGGVLCINILKTVDLLKWILDLS